MTAASTRGTAMEVGRRRILEEGPTGLTDLAAGVGGKEKNEAWFLGLGNEPVGGCWCQLLRWEEKERTSLRGTYQGFHFDCARSEAPILFPCRDVRLAMGHTSLEVGESSRHKFRRQHNTDGR